MSVSLYLTGVLITYSHQTRHCIVFLGLASLSWPMWDVELCSLLCLRWRVWLPGSCLEMCPFLACAAEGKVHHQTNQWGRRTWGNHWQWKRSELVFTHLIGLYNTIHGRLQLNHSSLVHWCLGLQRYRPARFEIQRILIQSQSDLSASGCPRLWGERISYLWVPSTVDLL